MLVKCRCCSKMIERNTAFKVEQKNRNLYYCSETEYNNMMAQKNSENELNNNILKMFYQIFGYKVINSALYKEINDIEKSISKEMLYNYLSDNCDDIRGKIESKDFTSEYAEIRYICAIVRNCIRDYINDNDIKEREKIITKIEIDSNPVFENNPYKPKNSRRKSISDFLEDM